MINSRMICLECLIDILENNSHCHVVLNDTLSIYQYLDKKDRAFITRLCTGTVERIIELDYIINQFSKVKVNKQKPVIRNVLRMAVYQMKYMDSVPNRAAINEAVNLASKKGFYNLKGFINGVLRNIDRNLDKIEYPKYKKVSANLHSKKIAADELEYLEVKYSMPKWIIEKWISEFDKETTIKILDGFLQDNSTTSVRCNTNIMDVDELAELLSKDVAKVEKSKYCKEGLILSGYDYLGKMNSFNQGLFYVQDVSSMISVDAMGIKSDQYIIDVCAAPGGKAITAALQLKKTGMVDARDISDKKVKYITENIDRFGLDNVSVKVQDALIEDESVIEKADIVIADLPCSGLGVIGQKADIKYNVTKEKLDELVQLQRKMLSIVHKYVKPGGTLLYSTCTINQDENLSNVKWFTENYDFEMDSLVPYVSKNIKTNTLEKGYLQLLPGVHNTDGFFIARMRKSLIKR